MQVFRKLSKICDVLSTPAGRAALRAPKPRSIASSLLVNQLRQEGIDFATVIDGGANIGQFSRAVSSGFPKATVHSFEPDPHVVGILRENLKDCPRVNIHQAALASSEGELTFHRNSDSQTSSVLPMNPSAALHESLREEETIVVPALSLDGFAKMHTIQTPILLKLDLQGYELEALRGASAFLDRCAVVLVETVFDPIYAGEPLFNDLQQHLSIKDFVFARPLAFLKDHEGRIVQMDAIFRRRKDSA